MNERKWSNFDLVWFISQILLLLSINVIIIIHSDSLLLSIISTIAAVSGTVANYLAVKKYSFNYAFAIVHVVLYGFIALSSSLYGDAMSYLLIYLPLDICGWILWSKKDKVPEGKSDNKENKISNTMTISHWFISILVLIFANCIYSYILHLMNDSAPVLDSISTTTSLFGMYLMVRYFKEQWWVWTFVNIFSLIMWIQASSAAGESIAISMMAMRMVDIITAIIGVVRWGNNSDL